MPKDFKTVTILILLAVVTIVIISQLWIIGKKANEYTEENYKYLIESIRKFDAAEIIDAIEIRGNSPSSSCVAIHIYTKSGVELSFDEAKALCERLTQVYENETRLPPRIYRTSPDNAQINFYQMTSEMWHNAEKKGSPPSFKFLRTLQDDGTVKWDMKIYPGAESMN